LLRVSIYSMVSEDEISIDIPDDIESDDRFIDVTDHLEKYAGMSALLTPTQREYLWGRADIEEKSARERSVRSRIRKRLVRSIEDLGILHKHAEPRDIQKAFEFQRGMNIFRPAADAIALIFDGITRSNDIPSGKEATTEKSIEVFESLVESSLNALYTQRGKEVNKIDVSIDIEFGRDVDEISTGELDQLDQDELFLLYERGQIGQQELISALDSDIIDAFAE
jgi:hypothetical protein